MAVMAAMPAKILGASAKAIARFSRAGQVGVCMGLA